MDWLDAFIAGVVAGLAVAAIGGLFTLGSLEQEDRSSRLRAKQGDPANLQG